MYLFVTIANVVDSLNHIFFLLGECHPLFNVWTATHVLHFSSGTAPLNFVWPSHNALSLTINLLIVSFSFIRYPYFCVDCHTFFPLFWVELSHSSLCECHTNALRVLSLIFVWMSHMRVFISLCECHTNILVSPLLLSGHSTLFPFRSWLTHSRSNLVWTATPHFLKEKFTRATSFLSFDNITNLFITTFIFPM